MNKKTNLFLVRSFCATYNHENYIADALKGFVMQQTTFPVVYTIIDDASTDKTPDVIRSFVNETFDLDDTSIGYEKNTDYGQVVFARHKTNVNCYFAVILLKENHFSQKKSKIPYLTEWMDTKYVAICEGDDYWIDPYKLQKQVDFIEQHTDYIACFHNVRVLNEDNVSLFNDLEENHHPSTEDIIKRRWFIATPSLLYRNIIYKMPEWSKGVVNGDYMIELLLAKEGKFYYMDDVMAVYRQDGMGISAVLNSNKVHMVDLLVDLLKNAKSYYEGEYGDAFDASIDDWLRQRKEFEKEDYYEHHLIPRLFRPKTYTRMLKKQLRKLLGV